MEKEGEEGERKEKAGGRRMVDRSFLPHGNREGFALQATLALLFLLAALALSTFTLVAIGERRSGALEREIAALYDADGSLRVAARHLADIPPGRRLTPLPMEAERLESVLLDGGKNRWTILASSGGKSAASTVTAVMKKQGDRWMLTGYRRLEGSIEGEGR